MQRVGRNVQAVHPRVVRVPGERGCDDEAECEQERRTQHAALEGRSTGEGRYHDRDDQLGRERLARSRVQSDPVRLLARTDRGEHARRRDEKRNSLAVARPGDECD